MKTCLNVPRNEPAALEARDAESGRVNDVKSPVKNDVDFLVKKSAEMANTTNEHHVTPNKHHDESLTLKTINEV